MAKFTFRPTKLPGAVIVEPTIFGDDRGFFLETYHKEEFAAAGIAVDFVQDNMSKSRKGVLRGLHFQREHTQGKLVQALEGRVFDVAVDLRPGSPAFGQWAAVELSAENKLQFYVPPGFAHGFLVLSDTAVFAYKCTDYYHPESEGGVRFDDPAIGIAWPDTGAEPLLSEKDRALPGLQEQDFNIFKGWWKD